MSDEQSAFDGLYKIIICSLVSFLSLQLYKFLQSELKQKLSLRNARMKLRAFSEKAHIGKIRNFSNEATVRDFFLFPTVCLFDFCKNMNPRFYILFLVDKSMT